MRLSDEDVNSVENFVRSELLKALQDRSNKIGNDFDENELQNFFGLYESNTSNFKILLGDRKLLKAAAERINEIHRTKSYIDFLADFTTPLNYTVSKSNTDKMSVGTFFGKNVRTKKAKSVAVPCSTENLSADVLKKVEAMIESFIQKGLNVPIESAPNDIVTIINNGSSIRADVVCVFCILSDDDGKIDNASRKTITIPYESRGSSTSYWNFGNLKKHFNRHALKKGICKRSIDDLESSVPYSEPKTSTNDCQQNEQRQPSNECKIVERINDNDPLTHTGDSKQKVFNAFAAQNLSVMETVMLNAEEPRIMTFKLGNRFHTVKVISIAKDGNCLYGACAHQLYRVAGGSEEHNKMANELRSKVAKHILENLPRYMRVLTLRMEEEKHIVLGDADDVDAAVDVEVCKDFVLNHVAKPGCWGGSESLMAIDEIFNANIIIFLENDSYYCANKFDEAHDRVLFLAYRNRNHYDSVCEINASVLYHCACDMTETAKITESLITV